ncbi:protein takeout-like [Sitophilus oryzae]|uniref:Protein takeout-like n=1 Tax=Sitophilus oryzae TaxID=7048 RepID=A0A6J2XW14_SITOR|nr:protein takeout-like [Sitophilus oryzae]
MLYFSIIVVLCLSVVYGAKNLPDYIVACKRYDPNLNNCAAKNANNGLPRLLKGDKEFKTPNLIPLKVPELEMKSGNNLKIIMKDLVIDGLEAAKINTIEIDPKKQNVIITVYVPWLSIGSDYTISGQILILPISGSGPANMTFYDNTFVYNFDYETYKKKDGKEYIKIAKSSTDIDIKRSYFNLDNLFNGNKELGENMNKFLNENSQDVVKELGYPVVAELVQVIVNQVFNAFLRVVPYDEILIP